MSFSYGTSMIRVTMFGPWRWRTFHSVLLLLLYLAARSPSATALHVVSGSNCTAVCSQNVDTTNTTSGDITCFDEDYNGTDVGRTFRDCVSCEMKSRSFDQSSAQTDLGWALCRLVQSYMTVKWSSLTPRLRIDNMRYAIDTCVYDYPQSINQTTSKPCQHSCANIPKALETNSLEADGSAPYDYCQDPSFEANVEPCASCYSIVPDQIYISNCKSYNSIEMDFILTSAPVLNTLRIACITKPSTTTPFSVVPSDVFTLNPPKTFPTSLSMTNSGPSLPHGAVVAIGICVPVFFFLVLTLVFLYCYLRIQNRTSAKKRARRSRRYNEKGVVEPHHGWHHDSTARIRPVSYVAPLRTRYSNPLAQIAEDPSRSGSHSDATAIEKDPIPIRSSRPRPPPHGLMTWERRGLEDASEKENRFSNSMKSTHQASGSTTLNPSDGRRNSGASGASGEGELERQRSIMTLTPPPLFSIPESSSSTFVPARSGWNEPRQSTSRNSPSSDGPQRSFSRTSQRSQELEQSLSRISQRSPGPQRSSSKMSQSSPEPRSSTSKTPELARSSESNEKDFPEKPTKLENTIAPEKAIRDVPITHASMTARAENIHEPGLSIFREVSYPPKSND